MASNHSGNIIKTIKPLKTKVLITFTNDKKLEINKETYTDNYFYEGKVLTNKEISDIEKSDKINFYLGIAIKTAGSSLMTEARLKSKLYQRKASKEIVEEVMKILKRNDVINDDGFILDYIEYANDVCFGENRIKDYLYKKGVSKEKLDKLKLSKANEIKKAKTYMDVLNKKFSPYCFSLRKQKIYNALLVRGFKSEIVSEVLLSLKMSKDDKLLESEINTATKLWMSQNEHKYEDEATRFNKFMTYLKNKGYSYNKIKEAWGKYYELND